MIVVNLILIFLVTIIPTAIYLNVFSNNINEQLHRINGQRVAEFRNSLDQSIVRETLRIADLFMSDRERNQFLIHPLTHDISNDSSRILQVSSQLRDLQYSFPFLNSVDLYYRQGNLIFKGPNVCFMDLGDCDLGYREHWLTLFQQQSQENFKWFRYTDNSVSPSEQIITYIRGLPYFSTGERNGIIAINLDEAAVRSMLPKLDDSSQADLWIIDGAGQTVTTTSEDSSLQESVKVRLTQETAQDGMFRMTIHDEPSIVSYSRSAYNAWNYVSVVSIHEYFKKTNELRNGLIFIGVALLTVNLLIGFLITKRTQTPIRHMFGQFSNELETMKERWERNEPTIRQDYLTKLLRGQWDTDGVRDENAHLLGIRFTEPACISFIAHWNPRSLHIRDELLLPFRIVEGLEQAFEADTLYAVSTDKHSISGMIHFSGEGAFELLKRIADTLSQFEADITRYAISAGNVYPCAPAKVSASYGEAIIAMEYRFLEDSGILYYPLLNISQRQDSATLTRSTGAIEEAIRSGDEQKLLLSVRNIIEEIRSGGYTIACSRILLQETFSSIQKGLESLGLQSHHWFGYDIRTHWKQFEYLADVESWAESVLRTVAAKVTEKKRSVDALTESKLKQYIEDNLFSDVSLESVSDWIGLSPNYVSKMFRIMTGNTFIEFVTERKMLRAVEMLGEKKLTVQAISEKLGYQSTPHFIRVFKERYGTTPKQYQKQHLSGDYMNK